MIHPNLTVRSVRQNRRKRWWINNIRLKVKRLLNKNLEHLEYSSNLKISLAKQWFMQFALQMAIFYLVLISSTTWSWSRFPGLSILHMLASTPDKCVQSWWCCLITTQNRCQERLVCECSFVSGETNNSNYIKPCCKPRKQHINDQNQQYSTIRNCSAKYNRSLRCCRRSRQFRKLFAFIVLSNSLNEL